MICLVATDPEGYGEYRSKEKLRKRGVFYIYVSILFKLVVSIVFLSDIAEDRKGIFLAVLIFLLCTFGLLPFE